MSIWGHRDGEPPDGEADESQPAADARETQALAEPGHQAGEPGEPDHDAGVPPSEPPPAFWRAQGGTPAPLGRAAARTPPPTYGYAPAGATDPAEAPEPAYGQVAGDAPAPAFELRARGESPDPAEATDPAEAPEPAYGQVAGDAPAPAFELRAQGESPAPPMDESPAGADAPAPVLTDDVVVLDGETAVTDLTQTAQNPPASPPATTAPAVPEGIPAQRWSEILAAFVDDPRSSVEMAADAVDSAIEEFVTSIRTRQRALASRWQGSETDTEQLRTVLRDYRTFWHQVRQLDPAERTGAAAGS
jgi:hypothetical protein